MTVDYHIRQLLYRNDCVIIPEFGAFLVKRISAKVDVEADLLVPPKRVLSFNPQLKNDDGLLISYLANAENLSYNEAKEQVANFVSEVLHAIQRKKEVVVEDLGKFSMNKENYLSFEAITTKNYLLSSFGLEEVRIAKANVQSTEIEKEESQENHDTAKVISLAEQDEEENEKSGFAWVKYAAIFVGIVGVSGILGWQYQQHSLQQHEQITHERVEEKLQQHIQEASFQIDAFATPIQIELQKEEISYPYHIVGGAFREEANAHKKVAQLKAEGFDAKLIGQNKYGLHQVAYQSFLNRNEAVQMLNQVKASHNSSAWLLVEK